MTHFRQRLSGELLATVNQQVIAAALVQEVEESPEDEAPPRGEGNDGAQGEPTAETQTRKASVDGDPIPHQGRLLLDASVTPADIRYPTDLD